MRFHNNQFVVCAVYIVQTKAGKLPGNNCQNVRADDWNSKDKDFLMFLTQVRLH